MVADLLGHASVSSSQVYLHPDPARLRAAVDAVPSPREQAGVTPVTGAAAARALPAAAGAAGYRHVLAGVELDGPAQRLAALLDPAFLAEAGWDPASRVLSLPAGHRLLGRAVCRVGGCATTRTCGARRGVLPLLHPADRAGADRGADRRVAAAAAAAGPRDAVRGARMPARAPQ